MKQFKWRKSILLLGFIFIHHLVFGQQVQVQGEVHDNKGYPIPGATVKVVGGASTVITDQKGWFNLSSLQIGSRLIVSYVGYENKEVLIKDANRLKVLLVEQDNLLEEAVVIGYGTVRRKDVTGSISSVTAKDLTTRPGATVHQALQGKAAGVVVQQNNGAPGGTTQIRIRGTNSILGDNEPMWVVDGFPVTDANMLNLADVESIDILKDASATAIYGSRGAAGVILITTKKGKAGKTKVNYDAKYTTQSLIKKMDMLDAEGYMKLMNIQLANDGKAPHFSDAEIASAGKGVDWQDLIFRQAPLHEHSISVSGGNEKTKYAIGGTYFDQKGIILGSDYGRISTRMNIDHQISKVFQIAGSTVLSRATNNDRGGTGGYRGSSLLSAALVAPPTVGPYNEDGTYRMLNHEYPFSVSTLRNPMAAANELKDYSLRNRVLSNLSLKIKPLEGLVWETSGNVLNNEYRNDTYTTRKYPQSEGRAEINLASTLQLSTNNILSYTKQIDKHNFNAMLGSSYESVVYKPVSVGTQSFLLDIGETYDLGAANDFITIKPSSNYQHSDMLSFFGRVQYGFDDRYLATFTFRKDGSSKYTKKWGNFPSAALAWRVSNENFMKDIKFVSNLKLRLGYGLTGNPAIDPYTTIRLLTSVYANVNKAQEVGFDPRDSYPGDLKWEIQEQLNVGLDASFLNSRLNLTVDYYQKTTRDLLNEVQLPLSAGYNYTVKNIGSMRNRGVEFHLDGQVVKSRNWNWNLSGNVAYNTNKVLKLYGGQQINGSFYTQLWVGDYVNVVAEGEPIGSIYGFKQNGYDGSGNMLYLNRNGESVQAKDLDKIADRRLLGNPNPKFSYGLNSSLTFKDFTLGVFVQGVEGRDVFNFSMGSTNFDYGYGLNTFAEVLTNHWTPQNPNAAFPKPVRDNPYVISDRFIYNGSYLRIRNIEFAYQVPAQKLGLPWLSKAQVYASGQNLFTFTTYPWYDPDVNSRGGSKSFNQGIDDFSYPTAKSYTFGLRVEF